MSQPPHAFTLPRYAGMSYEQASREADRIIASGKWFDEFEHLMMLRQVMLQNAKTGDRNNFGGSNG